MVGWVSSCHLEGCPSEIRSSLVLFLDKAFLLPKPLDTVRPRCTLS